MAIETQQDRTQPAGGPPLGGPGGVLRPWFLRPGAHLGVVCAAVGYLLGHLLGNFLSSTYAQNALSDQNDIPVVLGYTFATLGWLAEQLGRPDDARRHWTGALAMAEQLGWPQRVAEAHAALARLA